MATLSPQETGKGRTGGPLYVGGAAPPPVLTLREAVVAWLGTISASAESGDSFREAVVAFLDGL
jgi:hypothetical protein